MRAGLRGLVRHRAAFLKQFAGKLRGELLARCGACARRSVIDNVTLFEMLLPEAALRLRRAEDSVPGDRRRLLRHRAGGARQGPADPGAGGQLRAAEPGAPGGARGARADRRRLRQSRALRRGHGPRRHHGRRSTSPATRSAAPAARCRARSRRSPGATQTPVPLHHAREAEVGGARTSSSARQVGGFAALDYFQHRRHPGAAEPAKEDLKRQLAQRLAAHALSFPQAARRMPHCPGARDCACYAGPHRRRAGSGGRSASGTPTRGFRIDLDLEHAQREGERVRAMLAALRRRHDLVPLRVHARGAHRAGRRHLQPSRC